MNTKQSFEALGASCQALVGRSSQRTRAQRLAPNAMTLIELMVVVVILVTLVAGVLPLVSPNNEGRKIQETGRGLQTFLMQAQAEAARLGRPVGVGFRETAPGSGVAIEAFQLVVPKPYPGQSVNSRVRIHKPNVLVTNGTYGLRTSDNPKGNGGKLFDERYHGYTVYKVQFHRLPHPPTRDPQMPIYAEDFPGEMLKFGDLIDSEGNEFLIVDDSNTSMDELAESLEESNKVYCVWTNENGQSPRPFAVDLTTPDFERGASLKFQINRQPSDRRFGSSPAPAFQFPAGVALDLQASGLETTDDLETVSNIDKVTYLRQISLMFSPSGGIESVWVDGQQKNNVSKIFLLLGRVENGNPDFETAYKFNGGGKIFSDAELADRRKLVNWLNLDSRWAFITTNSGRFNIVPNASFNPRVLDYPTSTQSNDKLRLGDLHRFVQIEAAHELAHHHGGAAEPRP